MATKQILLVAVFYFSFIIADSVLERPRNDCTVGASTAPGQTIISCSKYEESDNETFTQILHRALRKSNYSGVDIQVIRVDDVDVEKKSITIEQDSFSAFPRLTDLIIIGKYGASQYPDLDIHPLAFQSTPNLTSLTLLYVKLSPNAIRALQSVKNQITEIYWNDLLPQEIVFATAATFTKMEKLKIWKISQNNFTIPVMFFQNLTSAKVIEIQECKLPTITSTMFKGFVNLTELNLVYSGIQEIEPGAFDDLRNLQKLGLSQNKLRSLPEGLFKNNKKLKAVDLRNRELIKEQISRNNFTHVDSFNNTGYFDRFEIYTEY